jgi:hypothetical protein
MSEDARAMFWHLSALFSIPTALFRLKPEKSSVLRSRAAFPSPQGGAYRFHFNT